ncbi:hypothetical protein ACHQM5_005022 [Ranunculus cassubicifolius]
MPMERSPVTVYLGERCWRQLTGEIAIPQDPPLPPTTIDSLATHIQAAPIADGAQFSTRVGLGFYYIWVSRFMDGPSATTPVYREAGRSFVGPLGVRHDVRYVGPTQFGTDRQPVAEIPAPQDYPVPYSLRHSVLLPSPDGDEEVPLPDEDFVTPVIELDPHIDDYILEDYLRVYGHAVQRAASVDRRAYMHTQRIIAWAAQHVTKADQAEARADQAEAELRDLQERAGRLTVSASGSNTRSRVRRRVDESSDQASDEES